LIRSVLAARPPEEVRPAARSDGVFVLDVIYVVVILGLFGLVALIARGVEKL
jgi:hypothetical protein